MCRRNCAARRGKADRVNQLPTAAIALLIAGLAGACAPNGRAASRPATAGAPLASSTLCADSYVLALAPDRVSALSWQAGSALSTASPAQQDLPRLRDDPERLLRLDALHVGGPGARHGADVALEWAEDFAGVADNLRALEAATGESAAAALRELQNAQALPAHATAPRVLYLSRAGGSAGAGTFVDAVIRAAGGINAAAAPGWHTPSVERVLQTEADIVVTSFFGSRYHGVSDRALRHAALRDYVAARPRIDVPGRLWPCAGPGLTEATRAVHAGIVEWNAAR